MRDPDDISWVIPICMLYILICALCRFIAQNI